MTPNLSRHACARVGLPWQVDYHDLGGAAEVQTWDVRSPHFISTDWRTGDRFRAEIRGVDLKNRNTLEKMLFNVGLFTPFATECAAWFNERLDKKKKDDWNRPTTPGEVLQSWGYYIALALNPSVPISEAWRVKKQPGDLFPPLEMGKHGLTKNRLARLRGLQAMMFSKDEDELDENDPWRYCRAPVHAFNQRRHTLVVPSWLLVGDESMCAWTGAEGVEPGKNSDYKPIPFLSFVERKPEPLGAEIKVLADGNTGAFLNLELQEGAEAHEKHQWYDEYGHTTACSLRLLAPYYKGPRRPSEAWFKGPEQPTRAYYGDSWFMGVNAAEAIYLESGKVIYPFGDVKTNTSRFPTVELRAQCGPESGDWATMTSSVHLADDTYLNVMAVAHRRGPEVHTYLSTHGLTTRGLPQRHKDDDVDADTGHLIARKSPLVLNDATTAQPKIDRGNRRRQFDLAMEKRFRAESFPFRLFITTLGICVTDTFYLDAYFNKGKEANVEWRDACRRMAWALMYNTADAIASGDCDASVLYTKPADEVDGESPYVGSPTQMGRCHPAEASGCAHIPVPLFCIPGYNGASQQRCVVCAFHKVQISVKTGYACIQCSTKDYVVALHPVFIGHGKKTPWTCAVAHRRDPTKHPGVRPNSKKKNLAAGEQEDEAEGGEGEEEEGEEEEGEEEDDDGEDDEEDEGMDEGGEEGEEDEQAESPRRRTRVSPTLQLRLLRARHT